MTVSPPLATAAADVAVAHPLTPVRVLTPLRPVHALELYRLVLDDRPVEDESPHQTFARTRRQVLRRTMGRDASRCPAYAVLEGGKVAGLVTLTDVVRGDTCSATVSVAVDLRRRGHGLGSRALLDACTVAAALGLHRLEAAVLPDSAAGRRLVARAGFLPVGLARGYRLLDGRWRDHVLYERPLATAPAHDGRGAS